VVEVDITHTDIDKNALYARMGILEFWRYDGKIPEFYQLQRGEDQVVATSPTFSWVQKEVLYISGAVQKLGRSLQSRVPHLGAENHAQPPGLKSKSHP